MRSPHTLDQCSTPAIQVAGGILDSAHPSPGRPGCDNRLVAQVDAGPSGHVIEYLGHVYGLGEGPEVLIQATLGGAVVVGGDQQAGSPRRPPPPPGSARVASRVELEPVPATTGQAPGQVRDTVSESPRKVLGYAQGGALAGCPYRADGGWCRHCRCRSQEPLQAGPVKAAVGVHGRNQGDNTAGNHPRISEINLRVTGPSSPAYPVG